MIQVRVFNAHPRYRIRHRDIIRLSRSVLRDESRRQADVGVVFVANRRMIALNRAYLNHRYTTDVLSFPLSDDGSEILEGEIYVNLDQARRQADEFHQSVKNEIARLVVHGVLHLVGYEDHSPKGKARMTRREDLYLLKQT